TAAIGPLFAALARSGTGGRLARWFVAAGGRRCGIRQADPLAAAARHRVICRQPLAQPLVGGPSWRGYAATTHTTVAGSQHRRVDLWRLFRRGHGHSATGVLLH